MRGLKKVLATDRRRRQYFMGKKKFNEYEVEDIKEEYSNIMPAQDISSLSETINVQINPERIKNAKQPEIAPES